MRKPGRPKGSGLSAKSLPPDPNLSLRNARLHIEQGHESLVEARGRLKEALELVSHPELEEIVGALEQPTQRLGNLIFEGPA